MIGGLILVLALVAATSTSRANILTKDDIHRFEEFGKKEISLAHDIADVERSASAASVRECLIDLLSNLNEVHEMISPVYDLVLLDVEMVDPSDERAVIKYLRLDIDSFLRDVASNREHVNEIVGECSSSEAVAARLRKF
jgi:hypothetical protein